jgi:hypothetical protein
MKMLCIRGRVHPAHTGLYAGQTYDVDVATLCGCCGDTGAAFAAGSVFKRPVQIFCKRCGRGMVYQAGRPVPWGKDRFVPFDPDKLGVTKKEVRELYRPGAREPEKV